MFWKKRSQRRIANKRQSKLALGVESLEQRTLLDCSTYSSLSGLLQEQITSVQQLIDEFAYDAQDIPLVGKKLKEADNVAETWGPELVQKVSQEASETVIKQG